MLDLLGTVGINLAAIVAIWAVLEGKWASDKQYSAMMAQLNATKEESRAWIGATRFELYRPIDKITPPRVKIWYQNTGREPAVNVFHIQNIATFAAPKEEYLNWNTLPAWQNANDALNPGRACGGAHELSGSSTAFPSSSAIYSMDTATYNRSAPEGIFSGDRVLVVSGCFIYKTAGTERHTEFCAYLRPSKEDPPDRWLWTACPVGNTAD